MQMPSDKEMRLWLIGTIVVAWGLLAWVIADQVFWASQGTPVEMLRQSSRRLQVMAYATTAFMSVGLLMITRVVYVLLRVLGEVPHGQTHPE